MADVSTREIFSFGAKRKEDFYEKLKSRDDVASAVLISTCNRTELFICGKCDPFELLCGEAGADSGNAEHLCYEGKEAFDHLCRLGSGAESQIFGEDQIITQVKDSLSFARECGATDSVMEVFFRDAIAASKRIKTEVRFPKEGASVATEALDIIKKSEGAKNVLVIGNGEVGRLMAGTLEKSGYNVMMTLRSYRHGGNVIPDGVSTVDYAARYDVMERSDAVVSGTLSPHFTIEADRLRRLEHVPGVIIDLAVPRDVEPAVRDIDGTDVYDMDDFGKGGGADERKRIAAQMDVIIDKYRQDFIKWHTMRERLAI